MLSVLRHHRQAVTSAWESSLEINMPGYSNFHPADDPRARLYGRHAFYAAYLKFNNIPSMAQLRLPKAGNREIGEYRNFYPSRSSICQLPILELLCSFQPLTDSLSSCPQRIPTHNTCRPLCPFRHNPRHGWSREGMPFHNIANAHSNFRRPYLHVRYEHRYAFHTSFGSTGPRSQMVQQSSPAPPDT